MLDPIKIIDAARNEGWPVRRYSGRGMYGDSCVGIVVDRRRSPVALGLSLARALDEADAAALERVRVSQDSLGLDAIVYWEGLAWPEGEDEDEDEDDGDEDDE